MTSGIPGCWLRLRQGEVNEHLAVHNYVRIDMA